LDPDERPVVGVWRWAPPRPVVPKDVILLRRTLAVAFALNVLLLASVVGGVNRNPLTGGDIEGEWEESEEHVDPGLYRDLTYDTEAYAIGRANEQLSAMDVGSVQELDVRKCIAALYCDHSMNNMLKWKIYDLKTWVWFDARTGEIIYYQTTREELHWPDSYTLTYYPEGCIDWPDTDARRQDTTTLALTIAGQFARDTAHTTTSPVPAASGSPSIPGPGRSIISRSCGVHGVRRSGMKPNLRYKPSSSSAVVPR